MKRSMTDIACGSFFVAAALVFGTISAGYDIGSATQMGPGYFPLLMAVIMGLLGLGIVGLGLFGSAGLEASTPVPWARIGIVLASCVFFGATISGLGLVPALAVTVFGASRAGNNTWRQSITMTLVIVAICALVFQVGLGLQAPLFGPWLMM